MEKLETDICIVGAGPAGLTTALYLAELGIASVVLEKNKFPRHKSCGDNISGNTIRTLFEFDPLFDQVLCCTQKMAPLKGVVLCAPNNHRLKVDYLPLEKGTDLPSCYAIRRIDLDEFLINKAKQSSYIRIVEKFAVSKVERMSRGLKLFDQSDTRTCEARLVIFATGSNSPLPQKLGLEKEQDKHTAIGIRAYYDQVMIPELTHYSELFIIPELMPGGLYITPLGQQLVYVNLVMRSDVVRKQSLDLVALLQSALSQHPLLKTRFAEARQIDKIAGSRLKLGTKRRKLSGDNFLLVGDAAGLIDLLSANGIPQALACAKIAAEFASLGLERDDFSAVCLQSYDKRVYARVENYLRLGKLFAPLMGYSLFGRASIGLMNFVARKFDRNDELRNLMYDDQVHKTLRKPSFYYRVFFGVKNREALSSKQA